MAKKKTLFVIRFREKRPRARWWYLKPSADDQRTRRANDCAWLDEDHAAVWMAVLRVEGYAVERLPVQP